MIKIELTREELLILIRATNWASNEFFSKKMPEVCIKVSELNTKLNDAYKKEL
jgi:hypothetical protein